MNKDNPFDNDDFRRWSNDKREQLIPKMRGSGSVLMIAPNMSGQFDIEFALQIGAAILLEKPLILLVHAGRKVPPKLRAIADRIIEADLDEAAMDAPKIQKQIAQAMIDFGKQ